MTNPPYEGATPEQLRHPLVNELLGVHKMFRNELATILHNVDELIAGEQPVEGSQTTARVQALIRAGAQYAHALHMHHYIETSMMFPSLQEEGLAVSVIDRLNVEHDEIAVLIGKFSQSIRDWSGINPAVMDTDLRRLAEALEAHLAYEETHVCPFLARFSGWPGS